MINWNPAVRSSGAETAVRGSRALRVQDGGPMASMALPDQWNQGPSLPPMTPEMLARMVPLSLPLSPSLLMALADAGYIDLGNNSFTPMSPSMRQTLDAARGYLPQPAAVRAWPPSFQLEMTLAGFPGPNRGVPGFGESMTARATQALIDNQNAGFGGAGGVVPGGVAPGGMPGGASGMGQSLTAQATQGLVDNQNAGFGDFNNFIGGVVGQKQQALKWAAQNGVSIPGGGASGPGSKQGSGGGGQAPLTVTAHGYYQGNDFIPVQNIEIREDNNATNRVQQTFVNPGYTEQHSLTLGTANSGRYYYVTVRWANGETRTYDVTDTSGGQTFQAYH